MSVQLNYLCASTENSYIYNSLIKCTIINKAKDVQKVQEKLHFLYNMTEYRDIYMNRIFLNGSIQTKNFTSRNKMLYFML